MPKATTKLRNAIFDEAKAGRIIWPTDRKRAQAAAELYEEGVLRRAAVVDAVAYEYAPPVKYT